MFALSRWKRPRNAGTNAAKRGARRGLRDLNNHLLRDIGLSPVDVETYRSGQDPRRNPDFL